MEEIKCKSCGNSFKGNYCNNCGEKVIEPKERTLKHLLTQVVNAFTFADGKFFNTLKIIILRPGRFSKDYVEGKRVKYMTPVAIFFLANLIYFLSPLVNTFTTSLQLQRNAFPYSPMVDSMIQEKLNESAISYDKYEIAYNNKTTELSKLLLIIMVVLLSMWNALIHVGSIRQFYADHLVVSFEIMTFVLFITVEFVGFIALLGRLAGFTFIGTNFFLTTSAALLLLYFYYFVEKSFYSFGLFRAIINVVLSLLGLAIVLSLYRLILFFITFWSI